MTPDEDYLDSIITTWTPEKDARTLVARHRAQVEQHLESDLGIIRMRETGSWNNGTAIEVTSDVDYFVTMPGSRPSDSQTSLSALRASLQRGLPQAQVHTSRPAISVRISADAPMMEIVPAFYRQSDDYDIPDPNGSGWIRSNPAEHLEFVNRAQRRDGNAKKLIRLVKIWRPTNRVPLSSIYLEMRTAKRVLDVPPVRYLWDMRDIFQAIADSGVAAMNDPSDYDGRRIHPGHANPAEHATALAQVTSAARLAGLAEEAAGKSSDALAIHYIKQLFGFN